MTVAHRTRLQVIGVPCNTTSVADLAASDPYQFQWWALGLVGARYHYRYLPRRTPRGPG
jgi:hypothetical protein